jgi:uncharacterized membrane protein
MSILYLVAVWTHIITVVVWIGHMFFGDPQSARFFSRIAERIHGIGWYAQAVLWTTGLFMLYFRGVNPGQLFSTDFFATSWGKAMWAKIILVFTLAVFQATVGHRPSKLIFGYVIIAFVIVGISVVLVRPLFF